MSVQRYETKDGTRWRVRWREADGRMRSRTTSSRKEANDLDTTMKARRHLGVGIPPTNRMTVGQLWEEWWDLRSGKLAPSTRGTYRSLWNAHVASDPLAAHRLGELVENPQLLEEFDVRKERAGVGPAARRKLLMILSGMFKAAVSWRKMALNPLRDLPKPSAAPDRMARPFSPIVVERIRAELLKRKTRGSPLTSQRDACLVSVLAYAGLRPQEALALRFGDIQGQTIAVERAVRLGEDGRGSIGVTKTRRPRSAPLVPPLRDDINAWKAATGRSGDDLIFPGKDGVEPWSPSEYNNWRSRVWKPCLRAVAKELQSQPGLVDLAKRRPYDCRGSAISLWLRAGSSPLDCASWGGHSPAVMFRHYSGVIEDLEGLPPLSAERQIVEARDLLRSGSRADVTKEMVKSMRPQTQPPPSRRRKLKHPGQLLY
jgi:integrase